MKEIVIYGAGGHAFALIELIRSCGEYDPIMLLDVKTSIQPILGVPVREQGTYEFEVETAAIAIGNNKNRKIIAEKLSSKAPSFMHKSSIVYPSAKLGKGVQVLPNVVIDADVHIGDFSIINNNATVSHNTKVGPYCHIAINVAIAGNCIVGEGALIGAGAILLPGVSIGKWAKVGAGAVVIQDVPDGKTVVGNPAKITT